ncbi:hypothetical protein, partial [Enterobacter roggenkampii]|uniref:hypothetical protein n=1 Tax=Enterobacter roggenkampii TaxID=1812935 RepID=UPI0039C31F04
ASAPPGFVFMPRDSPRYPAAKKAPSINVWVATEAELVEQDVKKPGGGFALPGLQMTRTRRPGKRQRHPALFLCHATRRDILQ